MGFCPASEEQGLQLVFEHVQLGSLHHWLHRQVVNSQMIWGSTGRQDKGKSQGTWPAAGTQKKIPGLKSAADIISQVSRTVITIICLAALQTITINSIEL